MKNDINIIKNELIEQTNEKKQRELERKSKKKYEDFKKLCKWLVYTSIQASIDKGISIEDIYKQRKALINSILEDIKSKCIEIEDKNSWVDKKIKVREYPYPDYEIFDVLNIIFEKEYLKAEKEQKKEHLILKEDLKQRLYDYLNETFKEAKRQNCYLYQLLKNLQDSHYKSISINDIAENEKERQLLESIYYQTLNEVKRGYDTSKPKATSNVKQTKLALPWRILGYTKAIKTIWKM